VPGINRLFLGGLAAFVGALALPVFTMLHGTPPLRFSGGNL